MIRRLIALGFGLGFGQAAWRQVPPVENATAEAFGLAVAIALVVAFVAGQRWGPERDAAAVAAAVSSSIAQARSEAAAQARASATQVVYVDQGGGQVVPIEQGRRSEAIEIDGMEAHELVRENLGLDLPYEDAREVMREVLAGEGSSDHDPRPG